MAKLVEKLPAADCLKAPKATCKLIQVLPIDNCTQVPNPGLKDIRRHTCFSRTLHAFRTKLPSNSSEEEKKLLMALGIMMEFDHTYLDIAY